MENYLVKCLQLEKHGVGTITDAYIKDGVEKVAIHFPNSEYLKNKSDKTAVFEVKYISENHIVSAEKDITTPELAKVVSENAKKHIWVEPPKEYNSHCWNCKVHISSTSSAKCPYCGWYICAKCGACKEGCTGREIL